MISLTILRVFEPKKKYVEELEDTDEFDSETDESDFEILESMPSTSEPQTTDPSIPFDLTASPESQLQQPKSRLTACCLARNTDPEYENLTDNDEVFCRRDTRYLF